MYLGNAVSNRQIKILSKKTGSYFQDSGDTSSLPNYAGPQSNPAHDSGAPSPDAGAFQPALQRLRLNEQSKFALRGKNRMSSTYLHCHQIDKFFLVIKVVSKGLKLGTWLEE